MPQIYRRRTQSLRPKANIGSYYRPVKKRVRRGFDLADLFAKISKLPRRFLVICGAAVLVLALAVTGIILLAQKGGPSPVNANGGGKGVFPAATPTSTDPTVSLPPRQAALAEPLVTPDAVSVRDLSFGAMNMKFQERQINQPAVYGNELFFSAGTGSLDSGAVLKKLYLYDIATNKETKVATSSISYGEFYETLVNPNWLVWLETDHHTFNYIYVMNRKTGEKTKIKNCTNGKPKLRMAGDTLIWMEEVDKGKDQLMMFDLKTQENMTLFTFNDVVTYGVSAPCIYSDSFAGTGPAASVSPTTETSPTPTSSPTPTPSPTPSPTGSPAASASPGAWSEPNGPSSSDNTTVVWAGPDTKQADHSTIYWLKLDENAILDDQGTLNTKMFSPGTYVHEPLYNGKYFVWIDGNYSPNSKLYLSEPNGTPKIVAEGITTYSLGDNIVVYGKSKQVWVYIISTGETCRLTSGSEQGILPYANGRTVVWYDLTSNDGDTLRYKVLSDEELEPGKN